MTVEALDYDVIIVGGGPAGLSAALTLGRARRRVLVATAGPARNAPAEAAHNVFTRDGTPPAELLRIGRDQLRPYQVTLREEWASGAERVGGQFQVTFEGGARLSSRGVVLATGVRDILPEIPGLADLWGRSVFHCPYCHGWEVAGRPLGLYVAGLDAARTMHLCRLVRGWSDDVVVFTDGRAGLSADDRSAVERKGMVIRDERIERLLDEAGELRAVVVAGGEEIPRAAMLISPDQELRSDLPRRLGCSLTADGRVEAGVGGRTAVPGVFVAGDIGPGMQSVVSAMAGGMLAGAMLNQEMLEQEFAG